MPAVEYHAVMKMPSRSKPAVMKIPGLAKIAQG